MSIAHSYPPRMPEQAFERCLDMLLRALHWRGTPRRLAEAVSKGERMELLDLRNTLANLDFTSRVERGELGRLDPRLLPCLFTTDAGLPYVVIAAGETPATFLCFDGAAGETVEMPAAGLRGSFCFFVASEAGRLAMPMPGIGWFRDFMRRFEGMIWKLLSLGFVLNLLALMPAFFVQAVYDRVLAAQDRNALTYLAAGIFIALLCDLALRVLRGAALGHLGARFDFLVGTASLRKLLSLPLPSLERLTTGTQIGRLKEFENLRTFFTGPLALVVLDLPFLMIYVVAIASIAGWLALVPVALGLLFAGLGLLAIRYAKRIARPALSTLGDHQTLLVELLSNFRTIKAGGTEPLWLERFRERSADAAMIQLRQARSAALAQIIAQAINQVAGAATLTAGALLALDGGITVGALIASMALVWRVLAPVQTLFITLNSLGEIQGAMRSLDQLMALPSEPGSDGGRPTAARGRRFAGRITFQRVLLRYVANHEPALAGVSFDIRPGEIVAVTGTNGTGKSTVLKLIANLYQPQSGAVLIDGVDTRQLDPTDLRQAIAYLPQHADLFSGTVAENLRLAHPTADDAELLAACSKADLLREIQAMPAGLATPVDEQASAGFARKLALARCYLTEATIVLLDEPGNGGEDEELLDQLAALRGRATVLLVTHRTHHVQAADRVIVLRQGTVVHDGTPQELMNRLAGDAR